MSPQKDTSAKIPKLRFREFQGEWEMKELGKIADKVTEKNRDESIKYVLSNSAVEGIVSQESYFDRDIANENNLGNYYIVSTNDFVYNPRISLSAPVGPIKRNHLRKGVMSPLYSVFRFHSGNLDFYESYFSTNYWHKYLESIANFGARHDRMNITTDGFYRMPLPFPSLPEQQKIASFLSTVDEKIEKLKTKKSLLEKYKKGVMQKIFSRKIRFRDESGEEFGKWEKKKLGEITKIYDGTHMTPDYQEIGIPFYSVEHVTSNNFLDTRFISEDVFIKENKKVKLDKGDILMTKIGDIGTTKYIDWEVNASFYVSLALIKQGKVFSSKYLNQFMKTDFFQKELWKRIIHVAFPKKINLGEIGECQVFLPPLSEQQKIAVFLSEIDKKIDTVDTEIKNTGKWKKGLLQGMLI